MKRVKALKRGRKGMSEEEQEEKEKEQENQLMGRGVREGML